MNRNAFTVPLLNRDGVIPSEQTTIQIPETIDSSFLTTIKNNPNAKFLYNDKYYTYNNIVDDKKVSFLATQAAYYNEEDEGRAPVMIPRQITLTFTLPTDYSEVNYQIEANRNYEVEIGDEANVIKITSTEATSYFKATVKSIKLTGFTKWGLTINFTDTPSLYEYVLTTEGTGGTGVVIDTAINATSTNPVENKAIKAYVDTKIGLLEEATSQNLANAVNTLATGKLDKTNTPNQVYGTNGEGSQATYVFDYNPSSLSFVTRGFSGEALFSYIYVLNGLQGIAFRDADVDYWLNSNAVRKLNNFNPDNKRDILSSATIRSLYSVNENGVQTYVNYAENPDAITVPLRDSAGHIKTQLTPVTNWDVTSKYYVDSSLSTKADVNIGHQFHEDEILIAKNDGDCLITGSGVDISALVTDTDLSSALQDITTGETPFTGKPITSNAGIKLPSGREDDGFDLGRNETDAELIYAPYNSNILIENANDILLIAVEDSYLGLHNLVEPIQDTDAATKEYVDNGLSSKQNTLTFDSTPTANSTNPVTSGGVYTALSNKQDALDTQTAYTSKGSATKVPQITTNSLGQVTGITEVTITQPTVSEAQNITYSDLKTLRNAEALIPGQQYRIIDYISTTAQTNTSSAGHQFDIIVTADNASVLNENARACLHEGDTYFADCNLEAWQLKYCIDNDTTRFAWANTSGKGVIYYMKDEFNNECPYDFKNILFTGSSSNESISFTNAYTFTYTENSTLKDASILGLTKNCYSNVIKEYYSSRLQLNKNIFYSTSTTFICYSNTFGTGCYNNTFGSVCHSHTFGNSCNSNTFGNNCSNNTFGNGCNSNTLGNYCYNNTFGSSCDYNTFGTSSGAIDCCKNIIIDNECSYLNINSTDTTANLFNYLQNVHIHLGVKGSANARLTIAVPDRNLAYEYNVVKTGTITEEI